MTDHYRIILDFSVSENLKRIFEQLLVLVRLASVTNNKRKFAFGRCHITPKRKLKIEN